MSRILVFAAGALFGIASLLYLFDLKYPASEDAALAAGISLPAAVTPPPASETLPERVTPAPATATPITISPESIVDIAPALAVIAAAVAPQPVPLLIPVAGVKASQLSDTFSDSRGAGRAHDAIDIMAPDGTPVFAVDDGKLVKLFSSIPGGLTAYQFDASETFAYYYAHLDSYAPGLTEGKQLNRGDLIGYVGHSGNANPVAPHLHFAIFVLGPEKRWWEGLAINPYPLLVGR